MAHSEGEGPTQLDNREHSRLRQIEEGEYGCQDRGTDGERRQDESHLWAVVISSTRWLLVQIGSHTSGSRRRSWDQK